LTGIVIDSLNSTYEFLSYFLAVNLEYTFPELNNVVTNFNSYWENRRIFKINFTFNVWKC